jgi:hypothetical protein
MPHCLNLSLRNETGQTCAGVTATTRRLGLRCMQHGCDEVAWQCCDLHHPNATSLPQPQHCQCKCVHGLPAPPPPPPLTPRPLLHSHPAHGPAVRGDRGRVQPRLAEATSLLSWSPQLVECPTAVNIFLPSGAEWCASTTCQSLLLPTNFSLNKLHQERGAIMESELWDELEAPPEGTCSGQGTIASQDLCTVKWRCLFAPVMVFMVHHISTTWWHLLHQTIQDAR